MGFLCVRSRHLQTHPSPGSVLLWGTHAGHNCTALQVTGSLCSSCMSLPGCPLAAVGQSGHSAGLGQGSGCLGVHGPGQARVLLAHGPSLWSRGAAMPAVTVSLHFSPGSPHPCCACAALLTGRHRHTVRPLESAPPRWNVPLALLTDPDFMSV